MALARSWLPIEGGHANRTRWDGSPLAGRRLLLWAEQGLGDTIQFARYASLLARPGEHVIVECQPELRRLLSSLEGVEAIVARDQETASFDVHLPMLSAARLFGTTTRSVPASVPYLSPESKDRDRWEAELAVHDGFRVGVVWAGSSTHTNDRNRSIEPALLSPLLKMSGVRCFSLQVGGRWATPTDGPLIDLAPRLTDFADTAAVIAHLDLVVTVDTAVAHLAGAIQAPIWVLLPYAADWRWMRERDDCPWYPTMRLFRQTEKGNWEAVIARVSGELSRLVRETS